jgi:AcrR family transcriptional regulator
VGFRAVTMELVAREANVAKATLYSYFKNKDELFLAVCARMARLLRGAVELFSYTHSMAGGIFSELDTAILEIAHIRAAASASSPP